MGLLADIEELVRELINLHGTNNPETIARNEGIKIAKCPMNADGVAVICAEEKSIMVDSRLNPLETFVTSGHELGHCLLHDDEDRLFLKEKMLFENNKIENEANKFAAILLFSSDINIELEPGDEELLEKLRSYLD